MLNTPTATSESLIVLDVRDRSRARTFLERAGATVAGADGDRRLYRYPSGVEAALLGHYLAVGEDSAVRAAIDAASDRAASLARDAS
jgi:hypothetical protein